MNLLATATTTGDIVTEATILSYTHPSTADPVEVIVRMLLGDGINPVAGDGIYSLRIRVNTRLLVPLSDFNIPSGTTQAFATTRGMVIEADDVLTVGLVGVAGDTNVAVTASVYDVTPAVATDLFGNGSVMVNHDYPSTDAMTFLDGCNTGIVGACIYIYLQSDFTANRLGPQYIVGRTTTVEGGKWANAIALNPGNYTAYFFKQGVAAPTSLNFTVT